jgi:uncharacterized protein DUF4241
MLQRIETAFATGELIDVGSIAVPSGRIVACDPAFAKDVSAFERTVNPGRYAVQLQRITLEDWGARIAFARVLVQPGVVPVELEPADGPFGEHSYFVDSGLGCFIDVTARGRYSAIVDAFYDGGGRNYFSDVLKAELRAAAAPGTPAKTDSSGWTLHRPATDVDIAIFSTGIGDGSYASYWALAADGQPVYLVTDFEVLEQAG